VRALAWTADGRQLVYITVKHPLLAEEGEAYLQVFDLASDSVVHRAAIDLEGKSIWVGAQVCGDTAFLMGISKHERRSLYRLYSAPLAHPEDQTELFNGYALGNLACEPG
jgi:hypothetical protein